MKKYIYIISHPKFEGYLKLGIADNMLNRFKNYSTYCPLNEWVLEYNLLLDEKMARKIEIYFRCKFKKGDRGNEWYKMDINDCIINIDKYIMSHGNGRSIMKRNNKFLFDNKVEKEMIYPPPPKQIILNPIPEKMSKVVYNQPYEIRRDRINKIIDKHSRKEKLTYEEFLIKELELLHIETMKKYIHDKEIKNPHMFTLLP